MRKIIFATIGLAMFATPLAAEGPPPSYSVAERHISGGTEFTSANQTQAASGRFVANPSGTTQTFGLTAPRGFEASRPNQDLRDRYGRIDR